MKPKFKPGEVAKWDGVFPISEGDAKTQACSVEVLEFEDSPPCQYRIKSPIDGTWYVDEEHLSKITLFDRFIDLLSDPPFKFLIIAAVVIWIVAIVMWRIYG